MQGKLRGKNVFMPFLYSLSGQAGFFPFAPPDPFPCFFTLPCTPAGWPGRTASVGSCWVQAMGGTGRRRGSESCKNWGEKASRRQNQPMQTFKVGSVHDRVLCAKGQEAGAGWSRVDFKMKSEK